MLKDEAGTANIQIVEKPVNAAEVKSIFMNPVGPGGASQQATDPTVITRSNSKTVNEIETTVE